MKHICHIRHALALDEKRVSYRQASAAESDLPEGTEKKCSGGNIKEVWFEGSHSDLYVISGHPIFLTLMSVFQRRWEQIKSRFPPPQSSPTVDVV